MKYYEYKERSVEFGNSPLPGVIQGGAGVIYEPVEETPVSHIALVYSYAPIIGVAEEMARRGFRTIQTRHRGMPITEYDNTYVEMGWAVDLMKQIPQVDMVLGVSWSGGNTVLTGYQAIAENGCKVFQNDDLLMKVNTIGPLTPFDGIIDLDPNWGAGMELISLDPAVRTEGNGKDRDPELDLFNPENGFDPNGCHFSDEFVLKFQKAQAKRMQRLVDYCLERVALIDAGKGKFKDDEGLVVVGGVSIRDNNLMIPQNTALMSRTTEPRPLIHKDGSITTEIVPSIRKPFASRCYTPSYQRGARVTSVKNFLRQNALRVTDDFEYGADYMKGVDWDSSYQSTLGNVKHIKVPQLIIGMSASYEMGLHEDLYANSASRDKSLLFMEGAEHHLVPVDPKYGDIRKVLYDYVASWIGDGSRFA